MCTKELVVILVIAVSETVHANELAWHELSFAGLYHNSRQEMDKVSRNKKQKQANKQTRVKVASPHKVLDELAKPNTLDAAHNRKEVVGVHATHDAFLLLFLGVKRELG